MTHDAAGTSGDRRGPLTPELIAQYHRDGFLLLPPGSLAEDLLDVATAALPEVLTEDGPARVLERDGRTVRSVYGLHRSHPGIAGLTRRAALLGAVRQLLDGSDVYVHQSKVNVKAPFAGDQWEWHQDYVYWLTGDGLPRPDLLNVAVFLDEVTEFNGPLTFVPGTHTAGLLASVDAQGMPLGYEDAPAWVATLTADEKFRVRHSVIEELARAHGMVSPKGPAGSVLLFHPNILHSSAANISPFGRAMLMFVYNSVTNRPEVTGRRPDFLADPEAVALQPIGTPAGR
ncbi:phytanoyl-CoA dioxygenase [Streptomyces kaniharaensis]|uniref:Phytanoyl-CoA dioxygenase n=1 Tax=Streptomyces kaniharaensis TaxID=212423 RepID=A0A6N7KH13_9ACTN|nr:phytanoyl-CoA dioxygenase family protein [Streptomyces kaniharaensis]MQS10732.1 phytanoyl-CoA dioxygenase [Streptomyces kaniharaensis]